MMTLSPIETIVGRLRDRGCNPRQSRDGQWTAKCPNTARHNRGDKNPSLSIGTGNTGKALVHCHTGCTPQDIANALELRVADLFPPEQANGKADGPRRVVGRYQYFDADGELIYEVERMDPKGFRQRRPLPDGSWAYNLQGIERRPLYCLPAVRAAIDEGRPVWLCEGEKDAEAVAKAVLPDPATTMSGGVDGWRPEHVDQLAGATVVHVIADDDTAGHKHARKVAAQLLPHVGRIIVHLPHKGHKDAAEHLGAGRSIDDLRTWWDSADGDQPDDADELEDDEPALGRNWKAADLAAVWASGLQRPTPTVLERDDGTALLYAGKTNTIFGESGAGKTWLLYIAAAQCVVKRQHVIMLDFEDDAVSYMLRMVALGVPPELVIEHSTYFPVGIAATDEDLEDIDALIAERGTALIGIDSTGEALAAQGLNQDKDNEVAWWMGRLPRRWARLGPCVTMLDHMPHGGGREIGSQRKRAGVSGAAYEAIATEPFSQGKAGTLTLKVAKDRGGNYAKGTEQAVITFSPNDDGTVMDFAVASGSGKVVSSKGVGLEDYAEAIIAFLSANRGQEFSQRALLGNVTGDDGALKMALKMLVSRKGVSMREKGKAMLYSLPNDMEDTEGTR